MKNMLVAGAFALSLIAGCESGPQVRSHIDPSANLSSYKTYMFAEKTGTDRPGYSTPSRATSRKRSGARWTSGDTDTWKAARPSS